MFISLITMTLISVSSASSQMENVKENKRVESEKRPVVTSFFDVRYGPITLQSEVLNAVFAESNHQAALIDTGVEIYNFIGLSLGAGMIREKGYQLSLDGTASSQEDLLTVIPFNASGVVRLDFFNDQVLVPFATGGVDYWVWQEKWSENEVDTALVGGKTGYHYSYGAQILLDRFDEESASLLEVRRGITDTYLSAEYRVQEMQDDGISFDSSSFTVGLRFQY